MKIEKTYGSVTVLTFFICLFFAEQIDAAKLRVLVIMSYEQDNRWSIEIKEGIDSVLAEIGEVTYFYMDTKIDIDGGEQKAREAYALYQKTKPDGIIAADDNAQRLFVVPYLKDKVDVPVMFCGVNAEAERYGYPASNVSGILERGHIRESIALAKQLVPSINAVAFLAKESPSGRALLEQVEKESGTYPVKATTFSLVNTIQEIHSLGEDSRTQYDAFYIDSLQSIQDAKGNSLAYQDIIPILASTFGKPLIGANQYHVEQGALCAVIKTGQEQGKTGAEMLLKAIQGVAVSEIPITRNFRGKRLINVTVMSALDVTPRPIVLLGAQLLKTKR